MNAAAFAPALLLLAACSGAEAPGETAGGAAAPGDRIDCSVAVAADYERSCTIEAADGADGRLLIVRKPDGGFRRLIVTADGVVAADGAEQATATILSDGRIEVEIGGDRFRLPATVR